MNAVVSVALASMMTMTNDRVLWPLAIWWLVISVTTIVAIWFYDRRDKRGDR